MTRATRLTARITDCALVLVYLLAAALPLYGWWRGEVGPTLYGWFPEIPTPRWSLRDFRHERSQAAATERFERLLGYRGQAIFADNSVRYHLFHEAKPELAVAFGDDGVLFAVDDLNYLGATADERAGRDEVDKIADKVARLQTRLRARGKALVPLFVPSKSSVYRDKVPAGWRRDLREPPESDRNVYLAYKQAFDRRGVYYADGRAALTAPGIDRALVWGVEGRHFTHYGACLSIQGAMLQYTALLGRPALDYPCPMVIEPISATPGDLDLLKLINGWWVRPRTRTAPNVVGLVPAAASTRPHPKAIVVGSSFSEFLTQELQRSGIFASLHYFYYNKSYLEPWPSGAPVDIVAGSASWKQLVRDQELYVVELFEPYMTADSYMFEFVDHMLADLDAQDAEAAAAAAKAAAPAKAAEPAKATETSPPR